MLRSMRTKTKSSTFVWFPLIEKREVYWFYCHLYGSHWTIHYSSLHLTSSRMVVTLSSVYQVIRTTNNQQHHPIVRICLEYKCSSKYPGRDTDVTTNTTRRLISSLTNIPIHYFCFLVCTNTIIYKKNAMSYHTMPPFIYQN